MLTLIKDRQSISVLLVAEHASAIFGGEALLPYQYFKNLRAAGADVHLVVHERTRNELIKAFPRDASRLHFVSDSCINIYCHKLAALTSDRVAAFTFGAISHLDTQLRQRRLVRSLLRKRRFDIVHEPIPVSPKLPSALFGIDAPVIIGPMNGGMDYPPHYRNEGFLEKTLIHLLRFTSTPWNFLLRGKREASLLLVANSRTRQALPSNLKKISVIEFIENGVDAQLFKPFPSQERTPLRLIHIGRMVDFKRIDLLIEACSLLDGRLDFHVDLIGDGPLRGAIEQQVQRNSLSQRVTFHGRLTHLKTAELLQHSDIMVVPSMREAGGAVVLEAMACGVPVIAAQWGGPTDYITPETGLLIPPQSPKTFVRDLAKAILSLGENYPLRVSLGRAGRQRAEMVFDWSVKTERLLQIYRNVVDQGKSPT